MVEAWNPLKSLRRKRPSTQNEMSADELRRLSGAKEGSNTPAPLDRWDYFRSPDQILEPKDVAFYLVNDYFDNYLYPAAMKEMPKWCEPEDWSKAISQVIWFQLQKWSIDIYTQDMSPETAESYLLPVDKWLRRHYWEIEKTVRSKQ